MWAQIVLSVLVGLATADPGFDDSPPASNPGWKNHREYVYKVHGRTLASLREVERQYSGVLYNTEIRIQPRNDGKLQAEIGNIQHSSVHARLEQGWSSSISDDQLKWQPLQITSSPFQIVMESGVITDLIVNEQIPNWEVNFIKSIVSQFQLNTNARLQIQSEMSSWSQEKNSAVFKTMEDTITGNTETIYTIKPVPAHVVQKSPWFSIEHSQEGEENVLELNKFKNYSNYKELPSYCYGFGSLFAGEPATNWMSDSFFRIASTHAILTGNLNKYTIQHSVTVNDIIVKPTLQDQQKGSVTSSINVTLKAVNHQFKPIGEVPNPKSLNTLVYSYEKSFSSSNAATERNLKLKKIMSGMKDNVEQWDRPWQSIDEDPFFTKSEESSSEFAGIYQQEPLQLDQAPQSPLLPYTIGSQGQSLKQMFNISKTVEDLARAIAEVIQHPGEVIQHDVLSEWITMTSLIRLLDTDELEDASERLYCQSCERQQRDAWFVFRDAVAESGTGPALQLIEIWIHENKIDTKEATQVLSTLMTSVRYPTVQYLSQLWNLVKSPEIQSHWPVNSTALLKYSGLVHQAYVNKCQSRKHFPNNSFGCFRNNMTNEFVKQIINYMTIELQTSISNSDTQKIHTYIRALGYIGHPKIVSAFEPYLEGKSQASQFQRFLMVLSLERLAKTFPREARSILFKIYQNSGETQQVRTIAVFQLMRTSPPPEMLQMMASFTNVDKQEYVSAAVKACIEAAAEENTKYGSLRQAAISAQPMLTKRVFGIQHVKNYIKRYLTEQVGTTFKEHLRMQGSQDTFIPKGLQYSILAQLGGIYQHKLDVEVMASSLERLLYAFGEVTEGNQKQKEEQVKYFEEQKQHPWSSVNIANLLKLKSGESEQPEGMFLVGLESPFEAFLSVDNNTLRMLPSVILRFENQLKKGWNVDYTKLFSQYELAYAIPTETGLPFLYTYDQPKMLKVEGTVHLESGSLASENEIKMFRDLKIKSELSVTLTSKIQGRLSFTTPYDEQMYVADYDKEWQIHVPLYGEYDINMENQRVKAVIETKEPHYGSHLFQFRSRPYTSKTPITNFQAISTQPGTKFIEPKSQRSYDKVIGQKQFGLALQIQHTYEREFVDFPMLLKRIQKYGHFPNIMQFFNDERVQSRKFLITYLPEQSTTRKFAWEFSIKDRYRQQPKSGNSNNFEDADNTEENLVEGIVSPHMKFIRASLECQGKKNIKHILRAGLVSSNIDLTSRIGIYYKKNSNSEDVKPYEWKLKMQRRTPNTHSIDPDFSLDGEVVIDSVMYLSFGPTDESSQTKIQAQVAQRRSKERKQYLKEQPEYKECKREMIYGNKQTPACVNITMLSGLVDRVNIRIKYENLQPEQREVLQAAYSLLRYPYYPQIRKVPSLSLKLAKSDDFKIQAKFDPDLRSVNVSFQANEEELEIVDIPVDNFYRENLISHAVYSIPTKLQRYVLGYEPYRPYCVVDETMINTFDNSTYPADISKYWTVVLNYLPKLPRYHNYPQTVEEQLRHQPENFLVMLRRSPEFSEKKEIMITVSSPETKYRVVDVKLKPSNSLRPKVKAWVNGKEVQMSRDKNADFGSDIQDGYIELFSLANGEVKFGIKNAFYLIYDGYRVRLSALSGKLMDDIIGLCGQFKNEDTEDFMTPGNCIARNYKDFIKSWEVEGYEGQQIRREFSERTGRCVEKQVPLYIDLISTKDTRSQSFSVKSQRIPEQCTNFQTRYVQENGEICFTTRPLPVCSSSCPAIGSFDKEVQVHCIKNSNVAQLWKNQIDKGVSPDFSQKPASRSVRMTVPQSCSYGNSY